MTPRLAASGLARGAGCGVSGTGVDAGGEVAEHERMRALREIKNQIMGNQTKKFLYLRLGTVPTVVAALAEPGASLAAARVGSYACGVDDSKQAILAADTVGAPHPTPRTLRGDGRVSYFQLLVACVCSNLIGFRIGKEFVLRICCLIG
jgi:hypothetical protein